MRFFIAVAVTVLASARAATAAEFAHSERAEDSDVIVLDGRFWAGDTGWCKFTPSRTGMVEIVSCEQAVFAPGNTIQLELLPDGDLMLNGKHYHRFVRTIIEPGIKP